MAKRKTAAGGNSSLQTAKAKKNDEFYTQYADIQSEVNAYLEYDPDAFRDKTMLLPCDDPEWSNFTKFFADNFTRFGLKKLISTSYAPMAKAKKYGGPMDLYVNAQEAGAETPDCERGRVFTYTRAEAEHGTIDSDHIPWEYLRGDGDFISDDVRALRDEADIIVTNPPFSLFREFVAWIMESEKKFLIIGSMNAITYKEIFPLIKGNRMWLGNGFAHGNAYFAIAAGSQRDYADGVFDNATGLVKFRNVCWFTNLEHGRRHTPLELMPRDANIKHSRHKEVRGVGYRAYDNYDAIEVPFTDAIPNDHDGVMGVPISFLGKYCPDQFEIVGATESEGKGFSVGLWDDSSGVAQPMMDGKRIYKRIFIRRRRPTGDS